MTASLFTRIAKLESRRGTNDQALLFWIKPGADVAKATLAAKDEGLFSPGDMVICAEWLGEDPMPKPRWLKRDLAHHGLLSEQEDHCITAMLKKRIAMVDTLIDSGEPAEVAGLVRPMPRDLHELSSVDLLHIALGVKT
jgi:hypothetical protein